MISQTMAKAINAQIGQEFAASLQYLMVSSYFHRDGLPRLAQLFAEQSEEEREHALRFVRYLDETGAVVQIPSIEAGSYQFSSAEEAVQKSLDWELKVTKLINELVGLALEENDHLTRGFLQWYVDEQLEEVNKMETLLSLVRRAASLLEVELHVGQGLLEEAEA